MNTDSILHNVSRTIFAGASLLFIVAFLELVAGQFGTSLVGNAYSAGRLIELAAALMLPVIAITLLQIRDALQSASP